MRPLINFAYKHLKFFEQILTSLSLALLLMMAMYYWMNCPLNFILEETWARGIAAAENISRSQDDLPYRVDDVMFIDAGQTSAVVSDSMGNHVIPDRARLDTLLQLFQQYPNPKRLIVCDLPFDQPSDQDSLLQARMAQFPDLLSTVKVNAYREIIPNVIRAGTSGTSGFRNLRSAFLIFSNSLPKFKLTDENCVKTLPLLLFEKVNHQTTSCVGDALHIGDDWYFNTIRINRQLELGISKAVYEDNVIPIQHLINTAKEGKKEVLADLRKKKFMVIGDFSGDIRRMAFGNKPGPMIIFDLFLSLQRRENRITTNWLVLTMAFFTLLFYRRFYHVSLFRNYSKWLNQKTRFLGIRRRLRFNWFIFCVFAVCSAFLFHIDVEVVAGLVFFNLFIMSRVYIKTRRIKWMRHQQSGAKTDVRMLLSFLFKKPGFKH